jgi:hypothetical protein
MFDFINDMPQTLWPTHPLRVTKDAGQQYNNLFFEEDH